MAERERGLLGSQDVMSGDLVEQGGNIVEDETFDASDLASRFRDPAVYEMLIVAAWSR